jgi:hypothetical protein
VAMTCAQMAIIPRNSANDANAAASSTMILNMTPSVSEQNGNLVYGLFSVKELVTLLVGYSLRDINLRHKVYVTIS